VSAKGDRVSGKSGLS